MRNSTRKMDSTVRSFSPGGIDDSDNTEGSSLLKVFIIKGFINHYTKTYTLILI